MSAEIEHPADGPNRMPGAAIVASLPRAAYVDDGFLERDRRGARPRARTLIV